MRLTTSDAYGGGSARASDGVSLRHRASELRRGARGPREEVAQDVRGEAPDDGLRLRAAGLAEHGKISSIRQTFGKDSFAKLLAKFREFAKLLN